MYEKVTTLKTFAWEGKGREDISPAVKDATLDRGLQLPSLKGTASWFGATPVNHVLDGGEGLTVCHVEVTVPEGQKYSMRSPWSVWPQPKDGHFWHV